MQIITGLLVLLIASLVAEWAHLNALKRLINFFGSVWLVGLVIIFAPEFRRFLVHIGQWRILNLFSERPENKSIDEIVTSARILSEKGYGALMVITRGVQLAPIVSSGTQIDSHVSHQLLLTIFTPGTPLHDLAVVIRGDRVAAANCLLPLSESSDIDDSLGSRHRAALGITEESDAIVVVVSEETGGISIAMDGKLFRNLTPVDLKNRLVSMMK